MTLNFFQGQLANITSLAQSLGTTVFGGSQILAYIFMYRLFIDTYLGVARVHQGAREGDVPLGVVSLWNHTTKLLLPREAVLVYRQVPASKNWPIASGQTTTFLDLVLETICGKRVSIL